MTNVERLDHECPDHARWVLVDWTLGTACNFRCSYCPPSLHDGKKPFPPPDRIIEFGRVLTRHYGMLSRSVFIQFTGGEVSLYSQLPELLKSLNELGIRCSVISNGSRGPAFWSNLSQSLHSVVLTHHIEFADPDRFRAIAQLLSDRIRTHIQVTMVPARFAECLDRARALRAACPKATIGLKALRVRFGSNLYRYTPEQLAVLRTPPIQPPVDPAPGGVRGRMRLTDTNGTRVLSAARILASGLNKWQGWSCSAGKELLAVSADGDVYRGLCREGGCLGNIKTAVDLPTENVICGRPGCTCLTDIMTTKIRTAAAPAAGVDSNSGAQARAGFR
jgi:hypothetical protein